MFVSIRYAETENSYKILSAGNCDNFFAAIAEAFRLVYLAYNDRFGPFTLTICGFELNFRGSF